MKTLQIELNDDLAARLDRLIREGWARDPEQAVVEALRRFLDAHHPDLIESQIKADVKWGLNGSD